MVFFGRKYSIQLYWRLEKSLRCFAEHRNIRSDFICFFNSFIWHKKLKKVIQFIQKNVDVVFGALHTYRKYCFLQDIPSRFVQIFAQKKSLS